MEKILIYALGGLGGGLLGFLYWRFVGCSSGTCPITSSPVISSLYGVLLGVLVASGIPAREANAKNRFAFEAAVENAGAETDDTDNTTSQNENKMTTIQLTKSDFLKKVVDYEKEPGKWNYLGDKPALIDFYADWCGPCKRLAPELEALAAEYGDQIYIYKVNTEKEQELAGLFGIRSIPTLLFIPMTGDPRIAQGALPRTELKKAIDEILLAK